MIADSEYDKIVKEKAEAIQNAQALKRSVRKKIL